MNDASDDRARRRKNLLINLSLAVGSVLLYLLVMEVVLGGDQATGPKGAYSGIYRRSTDPVLKYELTPGAGGVVNDQGYVGEAVPRDKPPGVTRVVGIGDSVTMYETAEGRNYLQVLEELLGGDRVDTVNLGVGGYDTLQEVRSLELKGLPLAPDVVVVGYCLNDGFDDQLVFNEVTQRVAVVPEARAEIAAVEEVTDKGENKGFAIVRFLEDKVRTATADLDEEGFYEIVFEAPAWHDTQKGFERLAEIQREHGFRVVVVIFPYLLGMKPYFFAKMHEAVAGEARRHGFGVVDLLEPFQEAGLESLRKPVQGGVDYVHPDARGHRIAAEALAAWLRGEVPALGHAGDAP